MHDKCLTTKTEDQSLFAVNSTAHLVHLYFIANFSKVIPYNYSKDYYSTNKKKSDASSKIIKFHRILCHKKNYDNFEKLRKIHQKS